MTIAKKWLQPVHYSDMVEERNSHHKCGLPLCQHMLIPTSPSSFRDVIDNAAASPNKAGPKPSFSPSEVKISNNYCSSACFQRSSEFYNSLDESAPITRSYVSTLSPVSSAAAESGVTHTHNHIHLSSHHFEVLGCYD
jgi:hypothetical protein